MREKLVIYLESKGTLTNKQFHWANRGSTSIWVARMNYHFKFKCLILVSFFTWTLLLYTDFYFSSFAMFSKNFMSKQYKYSQHSHKVLKIWNLQNSYCLFIFGKLIFRKTLRNLRVWEKNRYAKLQAKRLEIATPEESADEVKNFCSLR